MIEISDDATEADLDAFSSLESYIPGGWTKEMLQKAMQGGSSNFLKAQIDDKIIGYVNYSVIFDEAEINSIVVLDSYQRKGVGEALIAEVVNKCSIRGVNSIFLEVNESNMPAIGLYEKGGFEYVFERKNYYGKQSALIYKKTI